MRKQYAKNCLAVRLFVLITNLNDEYELGKYGCSVQKKGKVHVRKNFLRVY